MVTYEDITRMRQAVVDYANQFGDEERREKTLDDLLPALSTAMERPVTGEELPALMYQDFDDLTVKGILDRDLVDVLYYHIQKEEESLERVTQITDIDVRHADLPQLEEAALRMATMSVREYEALAAEKKLVNKDGEGDLNAWVDSTILFGFIKAQGKELSPQELREKLLARDPGVGYFKGMFEMEFSFMTRDDGGMSGRGEGSDGMRNEYLRAKERYGDRFARHQAFDAALRARHTAQPPRLLEEKTIDFTLLGATPLALAFVSDNELAVLLKENIEEEDGSTMVLQVIKTDDLPDYSARGIDTDMRALFDGHLGGIMSFEGGLAVGSDGILYVVGIDEWHSRQVKRYTPDLKEITDKDDPFHRAIELLKAEDILRYGYEIGQVVEEAGVFYFNLSRGGTHEQAVSERLHDNILVAASERQIRGLPVRYNRHPGGMRTTAWNTGARIVADGERVYFKSGNVMRARTHVMKEPFQLIDPAEIDRGCLPMNHCVRNGVLYVLTQMPDEEVGSIKAYAIPKKSGEHAPFLSHVYPENYSGGGEVLRTMAVSKGGLLAYSDVGGKKVHLYRVQ